MSTSRFKLPSLRSLGWLAGLPVLALLWVGATSLTEPYLTDAMTRASAAVTGSTGEGGLEPWLRVEIAGRDLVALGEAPDAGQRAAALARLAALPGPRRIVDQTGIVELASPFVWKAVLAEGGRIELTGSRPAEIGASALAADLTRAVAPGWTLHDRARAARGAPPDFASAAAYALRRLRGLKPGSATILTDTVLAFEGVAEDIAAYDTVREAVAEPPRGFSLGTFAILPPLVADFRFAVERRPDGGITLGGHGVSEEARATIRAAAAELAAGAAVEDRMQTARGLPSSIDQAELTRFVLRLAGLVRDGAIRFERGAVLASGQAVDRQAVEEIESAVRDARPAGVGAGSVTLSARAVSPYRLRIRREADSIVLSGHVPDSAAREAILAPLRRLAFRESIVDRTRLSDGAPPNLTAAVLAAIGPLSTLASGEIAVSDNALTLTGKSLYPESARRLGEAALRTAPAGWTANAAVVSPGAEQPLEAAACQNLLAERSQGRPIRFAPGSSELKPDFYPALDAVADIAKRCPAQRLEVTGHADPAGTPLAQVKPLPEYTASVKEAPPKRAKPGKDAKSAGGKDVKGAAGKAASAKDGAKPEAAKAEEKPAPEPVLDIAEQRALAIGDYLQKAGVPAERITIAPGHGPASEERRIGLMLRS